MNTEEQRAHSFFDQIPRLYASKYGTETSEGHAFDVRKQSLLHLLGQGTGRVLDIGCGPAVMTKEIRDLGWDYEGVDVAPGMINLAKEKSQDDSRAHFQVGSVYKLNFPDNYFDAVVAMGLVEYLDDEWAAVAEMRRVLKPGGRLIVSIPNWWSPARMWDRWLITPAARLARFLLRRPPSTKLVHREYSLNAYQNELTKRGFNNPKSESYNYRVIPRPFDFWLPWLAAKSASFLERLLPSAFSWIGTSFNVMGTKSPTE